MEPKKVDWKRLGITVFIVLLTAGVVGGTTWYFLNDANETNKDTISFLQKQVDKLNEAADTTDTSTGDGTDDATDETTNWKTYESKEMGFTVDYPKSWIVDDTNPVIKNTVSAPNPVVMISNSTGDELRIYEESGFGLEGVATFVGYNVSVSGKKLSLSGRSSSTNDSFEGEAATGFVVVAKEFVYKNNPYSLSLAGDNKKDAIEAEDLFKQIIASFEFSN